MKKLGLIFGAVCILAAVYLLVTTRMGKSTAADFLPAEALVCIEQRDLAQLLDDFKVSRLGRAVTGIDYVKLAEGLGLPVEEVNRVRGMRKQLDDFLNSPVFKEFFGQEFTLGLLPVPDESLTIPEKTLKSSLLLIAKPRHNTDIIELLTSLFAGKLEQTSIQHGKYSLKQYLIDEDNTLTAVIVDGYVIAALDDRLVKESLDRYESKQGSLAQKKEYIRLRHDFMKSKLFAYVSMPELHGQLGRLSETLDSVQKEDLQKVIEQWKGWEGVAFGAWKKKGLLRDKVVILFNKDSLDPLVGKMFAIQPVDNKTLAMVPAGVLGYYWTNTLDLNAFWKMFTLEMNESEEQLRAIEQDVKSGTGVELSDLLSMFGSEAVVLLRKIATDGFIPLPDGALFLKIEKEEDFIKMLKPLLAKNNILTKTEEYKGVKLTTLEVSFHPSLQPVYALHQGYLILASTVDLLKNIVDSTADDAKDQLQSAGMKEGVGGTLVSEDSFKQMNKGMGLGMTKKNNSVSFVRFSSLLHVVKELASWGGTMLSMQDREAAQRSKVMIEELIFPLLDGLAMYEVVGSRSHIQDDAIILESATILAK
ncbi:MAG: DUF3352 domain-containing protein [Desulfocapsaceae bacterium]|nr:DUF3352 domain-containing protein [Desulfocapsaceae bacterium]